MITREQINWITSQINALATLIDVCHDSGRALADTHQALARAGNAGTEYQRACAQILALSAGSSSSVEVLRTEALSPTLIRLAGQLKDVQSACGQCAKVNQERVGKQEPFECLVKKEAGKAGSALLRFRLNESGQIVEAT